MLALSLRTDQPQAELGLFDGNKQLAYVTWQAHLELAETIHKKLFDMLKTTGQSIEQVGGIICFQGPGSYTGLRIGLIVGNALSYSLKIPIVATRGKDWIKNGLDRLK